MWNKKIGRKINSYGTLRNTNFLGLRNVARQISQPLRIVRGLSPFPNVKVVRHKYCDNFQFGAAGASGISYYQWRANSMYDPDYTGVGHQPMFRDEMAAQYQHYTILSSYIKVTFPPEQTNQQNICLYVDDDDSIPVNMTTAVEQHRYYSGVKLDKRHEPLQLTARYNAAKWEKTTNAGLMADDAKKTGVGSNPSDPVYFTCLRGNIVPNETLPILNAHVELFFVVAWRTPVDHTGS